MIAKVSKLIHYPNSVINSNIECPAVIMQTKTICSVHYLFFRGAMNECIMV